MAPALKKVIERVQLPPLRRKQRAKSAAKTQKEAAKAAAVEDQGRTAKEGHVAEEPKPEEKLPERQKRKMKAHFAPDLIHPPDLLPVFPELFLAIIALMLLMFGVSRKEEPLRLSPTSPSPASLAVSGVICRYCGEKITTFNDMFVSDSFGSFMKILVITKALPFLS